MLTRERFMSLNPGFCDWLREHQYKHDKESENMKRNFYVVVKGRRPGMYESWEECEEQVKGFSGAVFKGFSTKEDAYDYALEKGVYDG